MYTSHDTRLYLLGKGILSFDRFDEDGLPTGLRDLGNCSNFVLRPVETVLEHWTDRTSIRTLDLAVPQNRVLRGSFTIDEYDNDNLKLALFGQAAGWSVNLLTADKIAGELYFLATNAYGPKYAVSLWNVKLTPTGDVGFISEGWQPITMEFLVQSDITNHPTEPFGILTVIGQS